MKPTKVWPMRKLDGAPAHEELLELLKATLPWLIASPVNPKLLVKKIEQAIAKAEAL